MTPTEIVLRQAEEPKRTTDSSGRTLTLRRLNALEKLRLLKAAGPVLADNQAWMAVALLAASVTAIQDVPIPMPVSEGQIEALVARLGDPGLDAIAESLNEDHLSAGGLEGN